MVEYSKLTTHLDLQNEPIFIPLFKRESIQKKFLNSQFSPQSPLLKKFSKINFTAFKS
jgi:hypothetical protein